MKTNNYNFDSLKRKILTPYFITYGTCYILFLIPSIISAVEMKNIAYTICILLILLIFTISPVIYTFCVLHYLKPINKINQYIQDLSQFKYYKKKEFSDIKEYKELLTNISILSSLLEETKLNYERYKARINDYNNKKMTIELQEKDLIYSISHELKTPISIIEAGTYAILDGIYEGDEEKEQLNQILKQCDLSISMIQSVLNVFKLNRSDFKLNDEKFDLSKLVNDKVKAFEDLFIKYNQKLVLNTEEAFLYADKVQISTVLSNVIQNAITNSEPGSEIIINVKKIGKETIFDVTNTNAQIPENKINHIFEPFIKIDESHTKKDYKGNGLGLYIVKQILNKYNYEFGIINVVNGVKFYFIGKTK
ncbi:MAG: HAMP domain-containing histidine kinase [Acholeplasmatales bacterium]|nr:HAMP domain-containing histidine kinase [Acholeplasmatales bacterium]